ncbi:hypothetical protein O3P69_010592 [Scylla paramamosain]|uniref:SEFIR domain-containing protein n=1 Tax=Scylla paramamosain TaxID=85552 RepID=A0AAW0TH13_SCYPA
MRRKNEICYYSIFLLLFLPASKSSETEESEKCALEEMKVVCGEEGGTPNPFCEQRMSRYCSSTRSIQKRTAPKKCYNTLSEEEDVNTCKLRLIGPSDPRCGKIKPRHIAKESLVQLRAYYHYTQGVWEDEGLVNLTFPNPKWQQLEFQSSDMNHNVKCFNFTLHHAINTTLMFDCRFRTKMTPSKSTKLTVQTDSGYGATYLYQIPPGNHINPQKTCPSDWHTFFYIQLDAIRQFQPLPVTVQSAPFGVVDYKVSLGRCPVPEDEKCTKFVEVNHVIVTKNTSDDLWSVELTPVSKVGNYTVRVQIVSDWCPRTNGTKGCYIAVSPKFYIPTSLMGYILLLVILCIILFIICVFLMIWNRRRVNREFFESLATKQTTTLLVYHPESHAALEFVKKLAEFLRNLCSVTPLMMDSEVVLENPTRWMKTSMKTANRVLFIVPRDAKVPSYSSFTLQWKVAMGECSGSDFIADPERVRCLAKLVHPKSGDVPCEISSIQRFDLSHSPTALANWLHGGTYLDQFFIWWPYFRSAICKSATPSWADVRLAAQEIGLPSRETTEENSSSSSALFSVSIDMELGTIGGDSEAGGDDGKVGGNDDDEVDKVFVDDNDDDEFFDPEIPNVDGKLCDLHPVSEPSLENSDDEDLKLFEPGDDG